MALPSTEVAFLGPRRGLRCKNDVCSAGRVLMYVNSKISGLLVKNDGLSQTS